MGEARPDKSSRQTLLVEPRRLVLADSRGQDLGFPSARRCLKSFELPQHRSNSVGSLHATLRSHALPFKQEAQEVAGGDGLDFSSQPFDRVTMNTGQEAALAPLLEVA